MRFFLIIFNIIVLTGIVALGGLYFAQEMYQSPSDIQSETAFIVKKGEGLNSISEKLYDKNIIEYPIILKLFAYKDNFANKIKAGEYLLPAFVSPKQAITILVNGRSVQHKLTVVEGKTVYDFLEKIKNNELLSGDITISPKEGTLMPDTYVFQRNMQRDALINLMQEKQKKFLLLEWENRSDNLPIKSPIEALILASIVEKETGLASERHKVASVFINRLRKGMRLQTDPTIIYGITMGKGKLNRPIYRSDIVQDKNGYNTYVIDGLPPTPICNPSQAAIKAVLHPDQTDYLFFVANGTGGHAFAQTLKEHNDNVKQWRLIEKKMKQKQ